MNLFVDLAKKAVESYVKKGETISSPKDLSEKLLKKRAGVFVTLKTEKGLLRGCIGTYLPTRPNIAEEIIRNAVAAAEDPRFKPIEEEELPSLSYVVYILTYPEVVKGLKDLDPQKYGIIVKTIPFTYPNKKVAFHPDTPSKSGVLLPGLPDIDSAEKQFLVACKKAEIDSQTEEVFIYRFQAEKY